MSTQSLTCILAGTYTSHNMIDLFINPSIGWVHPLLADQFIYPKKSKSYRVELELREKTNMGTFYRSANLFEMVWFGLKHLNHIGDGYPFDGYDPFLEALDREILTNLTVPIISFSGGKLEIKLGQHHKTNDCNHQLVATSVRY